MSSPQGLAERIIPARGAAQRATASFAEQLTDSPGRSDVDSPTLSNPFHEPNSRTKTVKYRYSATGKHLSSPLKGSSSSPERKPGRSKRPKPATFTPPPPSHARKGKAPAVATTSRKRKASAAFLRKDDVLNSSFESSLSPLSSVPTSPIVPTSDLPPSAAHESTLIPLKRLQASKTIPSLSFGPAASEFSVLSQPLSSKRKQKYKTNAKKDRDAWDIGNSVWVLVSQSGVLADNGMQSRTDLELSEPLLWWPAQVVQNQPLRVSMFGDFPSSSSTSRGLCTIFAPSSSNIQSINDDGGTRRFSRATFCVTALSGGDGFGPLTKKARLDESVSIETKWESAVQSMEKASTLENDGLPALLSSYATAGGSHDPPDSDPDTSTLRQSLRERASPARKKSKLTESTRKLKSQRSRANLKEDTSGHGPRDPSPCPPDPTLQIPGELILAMAPKTGGSYWPAQILKHVPGSKEKYRVKFLDDEEHVITRDRFWTSEEEEFVRCTLGEWESAVKTIDDPETDDEEYAADEDANAEGPDDTTATLPPPPSAEDFEDISVRAQLVYVKPVLRAILKKEYGPVRERHDAFMKGGSARAALLKSAGVRGGMDVRFVKAIQREICQWVLGDSKMKPEKLGAGSIVTGTVEEGSGVIPVISPPVIPAEPLACDPINNDKMEGVEGAVASGSVGDRNDDTVSRATPPLAPEKRIDVAQDLQMAVDGQEQPVSLPHPANGVALSPAIRQASLAPKSQLDLLAEVSQAVATEPSLLPSHPELPRLAVDLSDVTHKETSSQPSPLTSVPDEDQQIPRRNAPAVLEEFETLSGVERLDYCLNILLPEAIQQLLLWRSGERTASTLQSPEEEQRLHDVGARKAAETDWVDDVMRLRAAQARLWSIDANKKVEEVVQGGTRSRPRRGTVSRP